MSATTVESLLHAWGVWSRVDATVGPDNAGCGSAESNFRSPQCWDETKQPRIVVIPDDQALRIERAVIATGSIMAAVLRHHFILRHALRGRGEHALLREAIRRVGELLVTSGCATGASNRRQNVAAGAGASSISPEPT